jgi:hypothetical protein
MLVQKNGTLITHCAMSSERDSFAKGIFCTFAKEFLLHKLLLKVNYSPLRVKKSRSHDMGQLLVIAVHIMLRDLGQQVPQHDVCHLLLIAV